MEREGALSVRRSSLEGYGYFLFQFHSEYWDASQVLSIEADGVPVATLALLYQTGRYSVAIPEALRGRSRESRVTLRFSVNKIFPLKYHAGDGRELGISLSGFRVHNDAWLHVYVGRFHENALLNTQEATEGKEVLSSYPLTLGIDLYGRCSMNPPCVYCFWDMNKGLEGDRVDAVMDGGTLLAYGEFFHSARMLENCSIGEPLMNPRFAEILEVLERHGKVLEVSTNGQVFTQRNIEALVGKNIFLYVSLDAASHKVYSRIRNDSFDAIRRRLHVLNQERKKKGNWPKLHMVYMPMRVNREDLEPYFALCRELEAEFLVLRPLIRLTGPNIEIDRGGYHFDYKAEMLSDEEKQQVFRESMEYSRKYGVRVLNQFYFGSMEEPGADGEARAPAGEAASAEGTSRDGAGDDDRLGYSRFPLCREPWQSFYIMRRGVMPCCFGYREIAPMDQYREAWNSSTLQEIRRHLRQGTFSEYCLNCFSCPIVQRHAGDELARRLRPAPPVPASRKVLRVINRMCFRVPGKVVHFLRRDAAAAGGDGAHGTRQK
jgi:MoaA/NifB/PqqE/SkfB family radical SAM enzyme